VKNVTFRFISVIEITNDSFII